MTHKQRTRYNKEKGASLVEFALVIPLLMTLVLGIIEFSFSFARYNNLNKVTQEGARYFSDPLRARQGISGAPIVIIGNPKVLETQTFMTLYDPVVLPDLTTADITITALDLAPPFGLGDEEHIQLTSAYTHDFILVDALSAMVSLMVGSNVSLGPSYNMTASAILRVQ